MKNNVSVGTARDPENCSKKRCCCGGHQGRRGRKPKKPWQKRQRLGKAQHLLDCLALVAEEGGFVEGW